MNSEVFKTGLGQIITESIHLEEGQGMDMIIEVGQNMIRITEAIKETI